MLPPFQPDPLDDLRIAAAKFVLGLLPSWELPPAADRALSGGVYSDALAELATERDPGMSVVAPLFTRALGELGVCLPSRLDAAWSLAHGCIVKIASSSDSPEARLGLLKAIHRAAIDVVPDTTSVGDGLDMAPLISLYWSYSEPTENYYEPEGRVIPSETERRLILDRLAKAECRAWLARHEAAGQLRRPRDTR